MKKLNEIIKCNYDTPIKNIKIDSREVEKDDLFVAVKGFFTDHSKYIDEAINNGASAIITEKKINSKIPIIVVDNIEETLVNICKKFYNYNDGMNLIGVTGTDGKTTTTTLIKELLNEEIPTAYIGTNGINLLDENITTSNTTPTIEKIYKYLEKINDKNVRTVAMEVSSEALLHKRVEGLKFKYVIYTNITEDHLNIHKTVRNYINCKLKLINYLKEDGIIIINNDDNNLNIIKENKENKIYTYGVNKNSDFCIKNINIQKECTTYDILYKNNTYNIKSNFTGIYNVYNLTVAFIVTLLENYNPNKTIEKIKNIKNIFGRGENIKYGQNYTIILDYAHTENGIKNIVDTYKKFKDNRLIVVTGSAGGREKEKRSKIGEYLLNNTDFTIFTMDDPRYEDVNDIINDMLKTTNKVNYIKIISRREAIKYAFDNAMPNDIILILGKGRDKYMAIKDQKEYYSDYEEISKYFIK